VGRASREDQERESSYPIYISMATANFEVSARALCGAGRDWGRERGDEVDPKERGIEWKKEGRRREGGAVRAVCV